MTHRHREEAVHLPPDQRVSPIPLSVQLVNRLSAWTRVARHRARVHAGDPVLAAYWRGRRDACRESRDLVERILSSGQVHAEDLE